MSNSLTQGLLAGFEEQKFVLEERQHRQVDRHTDHDERLATSSPVEDCVGCFARSEENQQYR